MESISQGVQFAVKTFNQRQRDAEKSKQFDKTFDQQTENLDFEKRFKIAKLINNNEAYKALLGKDLDMFGIKPSAFDDSKFDIIGLMDSPEVQELDENSSVVDIQRAVYSAVPPQHIDDKKVEKFIKGLTDKATKSDASDLAKSLNSFLSVSSISPEEYSRLIRDKSPEAVAKVESIKDEYYNSLSTTAEKREEGNVKGKLGGFVDTATLDNYVFAEDLRSAANESMTKKQFEEAKSNNSIIVLRPKQRTELATVDKADKAINEIFNLADSVFTSENGFAAQTTEALSNAYNRIAQQDGGSYRAYISRLNGSRPIITKMLGEVGNLAEQEQENAIKLLPASGDNVQTLNLKREYLSDLIRFSREGVFEATLGRSKADKVVQYVNDKLAELESFKTQGFPANAPSGGVRYERVNGKLVRVQ